jgi:hypothetical protein
MRRRLGGGTQSPFPGKQQVTTSNIIESWMIKGKQRRQMEVAVMFQPDFAFFRFKERKIMTTKMPPCQRSLPHK